MYDHRPFTGTKVALLCGAHIVACLRDDRPGIPFPGAWDLPGGGREGEEDAIACGPREVEEVFGLTIAPAEVTPAQVSTIRFGDEGQSWEMMTVEEYLGHEGAVPRLKERLRVFLDSCGENVG